MSKKKLLAEPAAPAAPAVVWLSIPEAAERLGCNERTIRRRIATSELPAFRFGPRVIRIRLDDVDRLLRPIPSASFTA
jgi:excisionase family DNA binding protein